MEMGTNIITSWTLQFGMGCVLLATCGIGAQLGIRKCWVSKKGKESPELSRYQSNCWDQHPILEGRGPRDRRESDGPEQCELDPEEAGEVWPEPSPEIMRDMAVGRMAPRGWEIN